MLAELVAFGLVRANLCAALVILAVLAVRGPVRRRLGAAAAYSLWSAVLLAMVASAFPGLHLLSEGALGAANAGGAGGFRAPPGLVEGGLVVWLAGVFVSAARACWFDRRFRIAAAEGLAGPAVSGVLWPRLVTPADYRDRFTEAERVLIGAHEREHIRRRDPVANLLLAGVQALAWFNPLIPLAAARMRLDQEMACDEAVLARHPGERAAYARALLKVQVAGQGGGYGWAAFAGAHPLETRLRALAAPSAGRQGLLTGAAVIALPLASVLATWALAPSAFRSENPMAGPKIPALLIDLTPGGALR